MSAEEDKKKAALEAEIELQRIAAEEARAKLMALHASDHGLAKPAAEAAKQKALQEKAAAAAIAKQAESERISLAVNAQV